MSARFAWLLSLPVTIAGCLAAHTLGYLIVVPDPHARADLLESTGHGYLAHLPVVAAVGLAMLAAAAVWHALRGRFGARPSPWLFALLPPLAFTVQEHLERALGAGGAPLEIVLQPAFLLGLAFQLPFALLAYLIVGVVLGASETLVRWLRTPRPERRLAQPQAAASPAEPRTAASTLATSPRGPPARIALSL